MNAIVDHDAIRKALSESLGKPSEDLTKALRNENHRNGNGEDIARSIMSMAGLTPEMSEGIAKAISTSTGLIAYDLQAPAKNLYPVNTPLIKMLPRVGGGVGTATNWRQVNSITGSGWDNTAWVPEGQRAGQMSYNTSTKSANYATIGEEDQATWEAISAGRTFEDIQATMTTRLLQKMMLKEEMACLGGNATLALGTPTTPSLSAAGSGATLPTLNPYSVIVVALGFEGYWNSSLTNGVATSKVVTGADGKTFTVNGGSSMKSASATQAVTLGQVLSATVTAIQGATGYAWYVGAAGSETLQAITTINSATFTAPLTGGQQAATLITADCSLNSNGFNGLYTTAVAAGSGAQVTTLATGTAGTGTVLTASGKGSVNEIDTMLLNAWNANQVSPDILWVNGQQLKDITSRCFTGANSGATPLLQYFQDPKEGEVRLTAGGTIDFYFNPFLNGGVKIPIKVHPRVPNGTILGYCNNLPVQYQSNEVPNAAEVKVRRDYYQVDWPVTTRAQMVGVYAEEVLVVYAPFAMSVLTNIAAG